ncbi:MAG TPA: hypothetical protein VFD09_07760 [Thiopseudomonas sp.]|nr:hypothetical protein [Thiopseudomonas sp.]
MKKRLIHRSKPSALDALNSALIVLANSPSTQQAFALLALMTLALREVML